MVNSKLIWLLGAIILTLPFQNCSGGLEALPGEQELLSQQSLNNEVANDEPTQNSSPSPTPSPSPSVSPSPSPSVTPSPSPSPAATVTPSPSATPVANKSPKVSAGQDLSVIAPANNVAIVATASDDDGHIVSSHWIQVSGPSQASLAGASSYTLTVSGLIKGTYVFRILVTDDDGASTMDDVTVYVNAATNILPKVEAGNDITVQLPLAKATLKGSASDSDGTIASVLWSQKSGPSNSTIAQAGKLETEVTALVAGLYEFQLKVTDNSGGISTDLVQVLVNPAPQLSTVVDAGPEKVVELTDVTTLRYSLAGSAYVPGGTVIKYQWTQIDGPGTAYFTTPSSIYTFITNLKVGTYTFQLAIKDNNNRVYSDTVNVIAKCAKNYQVSKGACVKVTTP